MLTWVPTHCCHQQNFLRSTNFAVWMSGTMYPLTLEGLILCYTMAIPFFGNTLAGTLFYVSLLGRVSYSADKHIKEILRTMKKLLLAVSVSLLLTTGVKADHSNKHTCEQLEYEPCIPIQKYDFTAHPTVLTT